MYKRQVLECPDAFGDNPTVLLFPKAKQLLDLPGVLVATGDQCPFGALSQKPSVLVHFGVDLGFFHGQRCAHPFQTFSDVDEQFGPVTYRAAHQRLVRRKVDGAWATAAASDYPLGINRGLAAAFVVTLTNKEAKLQRLSARR